MHPKMQNLLCKLTILCIKILLNIANFIYFSLFFGICSLFLHRVTKLLTLKNKVIMLDIFHFIYPFGKDNAEVVYDIHTWCSLTDYGNLEKDDEFYDNEYGVHATIHKNHDPENNIDVFIMYLSAKHHEVGNPADEPESRKFTLVFDSVAECFSFLVPYLTDCKETLDFISSYHDSFHGKDSSKD